MAEPEIEHRTIQVGSARIYYQDVGSGPPVILVHGLSGSGRWWMRNVPGLAEHFHVYVVDLVGFGQSRSDRGFALQEIAAHLTEWMDSLGLAAAHVIGHSLGGVIALDLAGRFPERVEKLVLVEPAVVTSDRTVIEHVSGFLRTLWYLPVNFVPVLVQDAWRAGPMSILRAFYELVTIDMSSVRGIIQAPTLIVWGEYDTAVPLDVGRSLVRNISTARLEIVAGAGHTPMWERSDEFNRIVLKFLAGDHE